MTKPTPTNSKFMERDQVVLEVTDRYRAMQHQPLRQLVFPDCKETAVIKVTTRLCKNGLLERVPLLHRNCYFTLTPRAARLIGVSVKRTGPLGVQALPCELAALHYVCKSSSPRQRLTSAELTERFPWMARSWTKSVHCVGSDSEGADCLDLLRVVLGGKPDHVARKCFSDISRRKNNSGFLDLLAQQRFRLVIIAPTKESASAIRLSLQNHLWPPGMNIQLSILPQLLPMLGGFRNAT